MRTLSIRQPWVYAILHLGKDVENRTWTTNYRGPLLLHASQRLSDSYIGPMPTEIIKGGIVGIVELVDVVSSHTSRWHKPGQYAWVLENPRVLPFYACRGYPGLFDVDYPFSIDAQNIL